MALLGFKKRFAPKVRNGRKRQTIRTYRKYPIVPGETLYLYTGLRTKYSEKLKEVRCKAVYNITISFYNNYVSYENEIYSCYIDNPKELNRFAKQDGFLHWSDMRDFWIQTHGVRKGNTKVILKVFKGILITW